MQRSKSRIGLKCLLAAAIFLCIFLGIWVNSAFRQHSAVAEIESQGGIAAYSYDDVDIPRTIATPFCKWLAEWSGFPDLFADISYVRLKPLDSERALDAITKLH